MKLVFVPQCYKAMSEFNARSSDKSPVVKDANDSNKNEKIINDSNQI